MIPFSLWKAAPATPLSRGSFILFFYIMMPLSGVPQLEVSFSSPESGAADTPFWKFLCFLKIISRCPFLEHRNTCNFPDFPLFPPPGSSTGCCMSHPQFSKSSIFSPESGAMRMPLSGGSFLFYHNTMLTFWSTRVPQNPWLSRVPQNQWLSAFQNCDFLEVTNRGQFFLQSSMQVATQCLQVDCFFGKATEHLFDL